MGMTDSQFKAFCRFVLNQLKDLEAEKDEKKKAEKLKTIIDSFQKSMED